MHSAHSLSVSGGSPKSDLSFVDYHAPTSLGGVAILRHVESESPIGYLA
jgi:hypothetical protein